MTRRQYTTLVLAVSIPVPVGHTQAWTIENAKRLLTSDPEALKWNVGSVVVKLLEKKVTYL